MDLAIIRRGGYVLIPQVVMTRLVVLLNSSIKYLISSIDPPLVEQFD